VIFQPALDLYGVWPAAVRAAGRRGVAGYLLRFPDWPTAAWWPRAGDADHCVGAIRPGRADRWRRSPRRQAISLVLTGYEGDDVLVNDPAAPQADAVARRYPLESFAVWLERAGVGYVLRAASFKKSR
jgi:hypothetical protein